MRRPARQHCSPGGGPTGHRAKPTGCSRGAAGLAASRFRPVVLNVSMRASGHRLLTTPRLAGPLVAAVAALALAASADEARADGDPASDVVNAQLLYVSYQYPPPNPLVTQLGGLLERTRDKGYEIRVVVLSDRYDMGSVDSLWRKPQQYARFLAQEIAPLYKGPLLVVMPNGFGFNDRGHESRRELKLLSTVPIEADDGI